MRSTTPHIGAEPSVGPKTVVVGFPRVVIECLLALTERARGGAAAVEGMNFLQVGEAKASEAPRALHANGPPDAGLECLLGLGAGRPGDARCLELVETDHLTSSRGKQKRGWHFPHDPQPRASLFGFSHSASNGVVLVL